MNRPARILLITPLLPWPVHRFGGPQRTALILEGLRRLGEVELMLLTIPGRRAAPAGDRSAADRFDVAARFEAGAPSTAGPWRPLARLGPGPLGRLGALLSGIAGRYEPLAEARAWLGDRVARGDYDLIVCRYLRTATMAGVDALRDVPRVVDLDDLDWRLLASQIADAPWGGRKGRLAASMAVAEARRVARSRARRFDRLWVAGREDLGEVGLPVASVLPNVPFRPPGAPPILPAPQRPESLELLCVARLDYGPNREGLDHFLRRVWPTVLGAVPGATLRVVGGGLDEPTRRRWAALDGVEVAGFVDDLDAAYERCALTIAPVRWGGGTKIKVLESLAFGRACVATPHASRGFGADLGRDRGLWHGPTDEAMAEGCTRLLREPDLRARLAEAGRRVVSARYSVDAFGRRVIATCEPLLASGPDRVAPSMAAAVGGRGAGP